MAWDPSSDPSVVGYRLYQGGESLVYTNVVDVGNATLATITALVPGSTYYFAVTAYDSSGLESAFSGEIAYTVPTSAILVPSNVARLGLAMDRLSQVTLFGTAPAGYVYNVLATQDWRSWTTIATITASTNGVIQFTDPVSSLTATRCYRLEQVSTQPASATQQTGSTAAWGSLSSGL